MRSTVLLFLVLATVVSSQAQKAIHMQKATFGAGCFWCVEAVFERLDGVSSVTAGYAGERRRTRRTTMSAREELATRSGAIELDPSRISFERLLQVFWEAHDPTTLNRQGADVGTQYRSVIFTHNEAQKVAAMKSRTEAQHLYTDPIVTEIVPLEKFYAAENYHQDYFRNNPEAPYCRLVIQPKLKKLDLH